jgi:hypothetical protein
MVEDAVTVTPDRGSESYKYASALLHVRMETGSNGKVILPYMAYIIKLFMYSKWMGRLSKFGKWKEITKGMPSICTIHAHKCQSS